LRCVDVNLLVYALRSDSEDHEAYCERLTMLLAAPAATRVSAGERHWDSFRALCGEIGARGPDISDAFLAAVAIEQNATWLSADRGFARFPRLRWRHPLDT